MATSGKELQFITESFSEMTEREIAQFLTCARVGRLGMIRDSAPYIVPVGFGFWEGKIFFHTCANGLKMRILAENPTVCFEVDESLSDASLAKSVVIVGRVEVIQDPAKMIPYLQILIEKYRVPVSFGDYMKHRNVQEELNKVRVCIITPYQVSGRRLVRKDGNF